MGTYGGAHRKEAIGMEANTVLSIKPALTRYLHEFDGCFGRITTRHHLDTYVAGQLGDLERKSVEPIADAAGVPPRTLQEFLSLFRWDESAVRDRIGQRVARRHAHPHSVGIIDETSFVKKGTQTACVQRQHCGALGKTENCVVSVHLGYATPDFHALLDGELYLPEQTWHNDRAGGGDRCRKAGVPDEVVYRPKWQIALGQLRRAHANGVRFAWLTCDEDYGGKPPFLRELDGLGQNYVAEVPIDFRAWTKRPDVLFRRHAREQRKGRGRQRRHLKVKNNPTVRVDHVLTYSPIMRRAKWKTYRVKEGSKGPMVWQAKRIRVWLKDEHGLPSQPYHLMVTRNVLEPNEVKYFVSNAPPDTSIEVLLLVAFSRWRIERMFEESKGELGMDHFEVRKYCSIQRHLILSCVSHLFLAEFQQAHGGEKSSPDDLPGAHRHLEAGAHLESGWPLFPATSRIDRCAIEVNATAQ
jgi:SRSO17 transposase